MTGERRHEPGQGRLGEVPGQQRRDRDAELRTGELERELAQGPADGTRRSVPGLCPRVDRRPVDGDQRELRRDEERVGRGEQREGRQGQRDGQDVDVLILPDLDQAMARTTRVWLWNPSMPPTRAISP
jgi:hypothetical protein